MDFAVFIPIVLFACIYLSIKAVVDARTRRQMVASNGSEAMVRSILEGEEAHMSWGWVPRADLVDAVLAGGCQSPTLVAGIMALEVARLGNRLDSLRGGDAEWPIRR